MFRYFPTLRQLNGSLRILRKRIRLFVDDQETLAKQISEHSFPLGCGSAITLANPDPADFLNADPDPVF